MYEESEVLESTFNFSSNNKLIGEMWQKIMEKPENNLPIEIIPCVQNLWDKNIEPLSISSDRANNLFVVFRELSEENEKIIQEQMKHDSRFFVDQNNNYGIQVYGHDFIASREISELSNFFEPQDTTHYIKVEDLIKVYNRHNSSPTNNLQTILDKSSLKHLYVPEEGRIYDSNYYLKCHQNYQKYLQDKIDNMINQLDLIESNVDGSIEQVRNTYLAAETEYVIELLKNQKYRSVVQHANQVPIGTIFKEVQEIINAVEMNLVPEDQMDEIETKLTIYLVAIKDKTLSKGPKIKLPEYDDLEHSRSL